jgi:hypothetical protein
MDRPQKITLREMRDMGVRGLLIYCSNHHCSHSIQISADQYGDDVRLSDLEDKFVCTVCGNKGAECDRITIGTRSRSGRRDFGRAVGTDDHWNKESSRQIRRG